jgi:hypothetical protein
VRATDAKWRVPVHSFEVVVQVKNWHVRPNGHGSNLTIGQRSQSFACSTTRAIQQRSLFGVGGLSRE